MSELDNVIGVAATHIGYTSKQVYAARAELAALRLRPTEEDVARRVSEAVDDVLSQVRRSACRCIEGQTELEAMENEIKGISAAIRARTATKEAQ